MLNRQQEQCQFSKTFKLMRGFTFLEVLAALVILSVALIPIMAWVPTSIATKLKTERQTSASFLCQSKIEEVQLYYKLTNNFTVDYNPASGTFNSPFQDYRYNVTVDSNTTLKTISVSVWHSETPLKKITYYDKVAKR